MLYNPSAAAQVDAFADGPGSGNPAGVCLLAGEQLTSMTDKLRQKVAEKVNLSETSFLEPVSERVSFGAAQCAHPCSACGVWHVGGCPGVMLVGRNRFLASIRAAVWLFAGMCACCAGGGIIEKYMSGLVKVAHRPVLLIQTTITCVMRQSCRISGQPTHAQLYKFVAHTRSVIRAAAPVASLKSRASTLSVQWLSHSLQVDPDTAGPEPFKTGSFFKLRWFTPSVEVPLCGHATLASAAVLFNGKTQLFRRSYDSNVNE